MQKLDLGFPIADCTYPSINSDSGRLVASFTSSGVVVASLRFASVPAYAWQEAELPLAPGEPCDRACEIEQSLLLASNSLRSTMDSIGGLRHFRVRFQPWGSLDVLASGYTAA